MNNVNNVDRTELEMLQDKFQPISLRDHLAGLAMQAIFNGWLINPPKHLLDANGVFQIDSSDIAILAYGTADDMLQERNKNNDTE